MARGQPRGDRAAHREAGDHDAIAAGRQLVVGGLGRARPVGPARREHVVDRRAVAGQQRQLGGESRGGERLRQPAHRLRAAREAVHHQRAVRAAGRRERLRAGEYVTHGATFGHVSHTCRAPA